MEPTGSSYEVVLVDDGSGRSFELLKKMAANDPALVIVSFRRNFDRLQQCKQESTTRGEFVALMDADLQNDPADIPQC